MKYMIMVLLLASCAGIKEKPKFELISDLPYGDNDVILLEEFKIGKKHCLWGSKDFDDKCQDAAMEYAYGAKWKEFKKVALNFVKYVNAKNTKKLISLFDWGPDENGHFSISILNKTDKNKSGYCVPEIGNHRYFFTLFDCSVQGYCYDSNTQKRIEGVKYSIRIGNEETIFPDDPMELLEKYLNNIMQDASESIKGTEYKNFLLESDNFGGYIIKISKYTNIDFVRYKIYPKWKFTRNIPKIRSFDCY